MPDQSAETPAKPKKERKPKEAIVFLPEPEVRLGSLSIANPQELVKRATDIATTLAEIINKQNLFSIIKNKKTGEKLKYVRCEGWTTCGALLGVIPVEDYCRKLENGKGYEAKINLIRTKDGGLVGSASAECTTDEMLWKSRDTHSLRSMALTRATGKAFRLSFSWIIKLAGFEPTPAEEMMSQEDAPIEAQAVADEVERQKSGKDAGNGSNGVECLFWTYPTAHNGFYAEFINLKEYGSGLNEVAQEGLRVTLKKYLAVGRGDTLLIPREKMPALIQELTDCKVPLKELAPQ